MNIILPVIKDFADDYAKSLEEFGISEKSIKMVDLYYLKKNLKSDIGFLWMIGSKSQII